MAKFEDSGMIPPATNVPLTPAEPQDASGESLNNTKASMQPV